MNIQTIKIKPKHQIWAKERFYKAGDEAHLVSDLNADELAALIEMSPDDFVGLATEEKTDEGEAGVTAQATTPGGPAPLGQPRDIGPGTAPAGPIPEPARRRGRQGEGEADV